MNQRQKEKFADKLMDIANFAVGALLIGQIIAKEFNWSWIIIGGFIWIVLYGIAYRLLADRLEQRG